MATRNEQSIEIHGVQPLLRDVAVHNGGIDAVLEAGAKQTDSLDTTLTSSRPAYQGIQHTPCLFENVLSVGSVQRVKIVGGIASNIHWGP
jgi:hypothetical protein